MRFQSTVLSLPQFLILLLALGLAMPAQSRDHGDIRFRHVTSDFAVAPQLSIEDIRKAAEQGYRVVINHRPDGEGGAAQPTSAELEEVAKEVGITYFYIPFRPGHVTDEALNQTKMILASQKGKTISFCLSGSRAVTVWAMAQSALGNMQPDETIRAARGAGYDLGAQRQSLQALAAGNTP